MTAREDFFRKLDASQTLYTTLEFYNSGFGVKRYVTAQQVDKDFRLEVNAPRDADTVVTFEAVSFLAPEPEQADEDVSLEIVMSGAGLQIEEFMKQRVKREPTQVIWRQHLSGETYPVFVLPFELKELQLQELQAKLTAKQVNFAGLDISERYTTDRFPGLKQGI